jgi:hypothetical protein
MVANPEVMALTYGIRYSLVLSNITYSIIPNIVNCTITIARWSKLMSGLLWIVGPVAVVVVVVVVVVVLDVCFTYPKRNQDPIPYAITTVSMKYTVSSVLS